MSNIQVIGVSGKAGTGKDFIAQNILRPIGYYQFSLAWHFKVWTVGKGTGTHEEVFVTKPPHVRKELQLEGTERGRHAYGDDVWCNTTAEWLNVLHEHWGINKFVIPDVRFPNEVRFIQNTFGGKVLGIHAPTRAESSSLTPEARLHESETALDDFVGFDAIINNEPSNIRNVRTEIYTSLKLDVIEPQFNEW